MNCSACLSGINADEEYLRCTVMGCSKCYHLLCTRESKLTKTAAAAWVCPECICVAKKGGDNSLTPVGITKKLRDCNVTIRQKVVHILSEEEENLDDTQDLKREVCELRREMVLMREQLVSSNILIADYESKLRQSLSTIVDYDKKLSQSVSIIARFETSMEKYALQTDRLLDKLKKFECGSNIQSPVARESHLQVSHAISDVLQAPSLFPVGASPGPSSSSHQPRQSSVVTRTNKPNNSAQVQTQKKKVLTARRTPTVKEQSSQPSPNSPSGSASQLEPKSVGAGGDDQQWVEVKTHKNRRLTSMCGAAGPTVTSLKAVELRKHMHLWNMASGIEEVRQYLDQLCPNGSCTVEELTAKGNYKSYKIGVPPAYYDTCFSIEVWPINARIKAWVNFRKPAKHTSPISSAEPSTSPRPFRDRPSDRAAPTQ